MKRTENQNTFGIRNSKSITLAVITVLILIAFPSGNVGAYEVELMWENAYGGMQDDFAEDVLVTADGSIVVVGTTYSFGAGNSDVYLLKTDTNGTQVRDKTFGTSEYEFGNAFRLTSDNGLVIAGWKSHEPSVNYAKLVLIKADLDGNEIWTKDFTYDTGMWAHSVTEALDSGYVAVGSCYISNSSKVGLLRTDSAGNQVWLKVYDSPLSYAESAKHIERTPDGGFILCGRESDNTGRGFLLKTGPNNNLQWREIYFNNSHELVFTCVRPTSDGNYIVSGYTHRNYDYDGYIAKIDQEGNMLWSREYDLESLSELFTDIIETDTDEYVVCGYIRNSYKAFCIKVTSFGNVVWKRILDNAIDVKAVVKTDNRAFFVAGKTESFSAGNEDVYLAKIQEPVVSTPLLYAEPNQLLFVSSIDYNRPNVQTAVIYNQGISTLKWHIPEDCDWLNITPTSGSSLGDINEIEISIDKTGLDVGTYTYDVQVVDHNAANSPYIIEVKLIIREYNATVPDKFDTIQEAIDAAYDGDTVVVADGSYTGEGNRDIDFRGKAITVKSENGPGSCIIDCEEQGRGFYFYSGEDANSILDGFTITNGQVSWPHPVPHSGGGIHCYQSSPTIRNCTISENSNEDFSAVGGGIYCEGGSPTIRNCTISDNRIDGKIGSGGGIYCYDSNATIEDCTIRRNRSCFCGGISCYGGWPTVRNCIISDNRGHGISSHNTSPTISDCIISNNRGVGIFCYGDKPTISNCTISGNSSQSYRSAGGIECQNSSPTITNCTFTGNSAGWGGGICNNDSSPTITNCTISYNSAYYGGGIYCRGESYAVITNCTVNTNKAEFGGGIYCGMESNTTIINSVLRGNEAPDGPEIYLDGDNSEVQVSYSNIQGGWEGQGNIESELGFAFSGDCHLMPGSACIDAGTSAPAGGLPAKDIDGNPRVLDGDGDGDAIVDMGAYEFNSQKPAIAVSSDRFFYRNDWPEIASQTLSIRNSGGRTLNWEIIEDCQWLKAAPISGTSTGNINEVTLTIDASDLETGLYSCTLTVLDSNASNNPVTVQIELDLGAILRVPGQFDTIQAAVDAANDYDIVLVADGIYTGDGNRDIIVDRKGITIRSENGPENCIIDCNAMLNEYHCGFNFSNNQDINSVIDGFTIINGYTTDRSGGIDCRNSALTISNCNISGNTTFWSHRYSGGISVMDGIYLINNCMISNNSSVNGDGGGIVCNRAEVTISDCNISGNNSFGRSGKGGGICVMDGIYSIYNSTITGNEATFGGGISTYESIYLINNCMISNNSADKGGGVYCYSEGYDYDNNSMISNSMLAGNSVNNFGGGICCDGMSPAIRNCMITGNSSLDRGGGIRCYRSSPTITNCTLADNLAPKGSALTCESSRPTSNFELSNCIVCDEIFKDDNSTITASYSNVQGGWEGEGNIDADPCFVDPGFWDANGTPEDANDDFWIEGDYHLLPGSLCIDAGDPCYVPEPNETDLDGNPRVINGRIDMGAYEFIPPIEAAMKLTPRRIIRHSRKKFIMVWLRLPEDITKDQIDSNEPLLLYPGGIEAQLQHIFEHGKKGDKRVTILAFFDKSELTEAVPDNGQVQLEVVGYLTTSQQFYGSSFLTILDRQQPRRWRWRRPR